MIEDAKEDAEQDRRFPDIDKLRRFSLGVGIALLIYVFAGGKFGDHVQTILTPIVEFERPWVLLGALLLASIYSTYRYWYYGIHLASTRAKIRKYLRQPESVYVFVGDETFYEQANAGSNQMLHPEHT